MAWNDSMTLTGKHIVITRAAHQQAEFAALLIAEGAQSLPYPALEIVPTEPGAWQTGGSFDWIIFTSANAAQAAAGRLPVTAGTRIAAVGAATADAVRRYLGVSADVTPPNAAVVHLLDALPVNAGERVLLPQSDSAPPELARRLGERGVVVTTVTTYRVITGSGGVTLPTLIARRAVDAITFTSGSTVNHCLIRYTNEGGKVHDLEDVPLACFGRSARTALKAAGLSPAITAETNSLAALVTALKDYFHAE